MLQTVLKTIERYGMFPSPGKVTVALSGGADSMALLSLLLKVRERYGLTVTAAHLNHLLRGSESERDEAFVRGVCEKLGVELAVKRLDVAALARRKGIGLELAGRQARYAWFSDFEGQVALAHTASDSLETVLFNLCRGTGMQGLAGIAPMRGAFVRPLIECTREMVEAYCAENEIPYVIDSSNAHLQFARNRMRQLVVPQLKEINPAVEGNVLRTARILRRESDFLTDLAKETLNKIRQEDALPADALKTLHPAIRGRILALFAAPVDATHVEALMNLIAQGRGRQSLSGDRMAVLENGFLSVVPISVEPPQYVVDYETISISEFDKIRKVHTLLSKTALDCDKITGKLVQRTRLPGDKIRLSGRKGTKTLKKWFNEAKIPLIERDVLPVLSDEYGPVWVEELGVAQRVEVDETTRQVLLVRCRKKE